MALLRAHGSQWAQPLQRAARHSAAVVGVFAMPACAARQCPSLAAACVQLLPWRAIACSPRVTVPAASAAAAAAAPAGGEPPAERNARAQALSAIRTSGKGAADAMDVWAMSSKKFARARAEAKASGGPARLPDLPQPASLAHITKRPSDSRLSVLLPFSSDAELRRQFITASGQMRIGRLFEEIDAFCGNIAYLHCDDEDEVRGVACGMLTVRFAVPAAARCSPITTFASSFMLA